MQLVAMVKETGNINHWLEASLTLITLTRQTIECVIDTGFRGELVLPRSFVTTIPFTRAGRELFTLVGGEEMEAQVVLTEIIWLGQKRTVRVVISESDDALIGTQLLQGTRLVIDYVSSEVEISNAE